MTRENKVRKSKQICKTTSFVPTRSFVNLPLIRNNNLNKTQNEIFSTIYLVLEGGYNFIAVNTISLDIPYFHQKLHNSSTLALNGIHLLGVFN